MLKRLTFFLILSFCFSYYPLSAGETIRILAIGNSFSEDAVENYLYNLAKADDVTLIIGNMYIGGCSLQTHRDNAKGNLKAYSYRKIDATGNKKTTENVSISEAVADENWDYISFQQVSQNSGQYSTYFPYLTELMEYVKTASTNPNVKYALHVTWAYAKNSTHSGFANYNNDQIQMYNAIVNAATSVAKTAEIDIIIPSGTAIQNARTSFIGDNFCRDGYHLDLSYGRYTAACTWYEKLTGNSVVENKDAPAGILPLYIEVAKNAAHYAVQNPTEVTDMNEEKPLPDPETFELEAPVNIDFGNTSTASALSWNNITSYSKGFTALGLTDMNGNSTPFKLEITKAFGGINQDGPANGLTIADWTLPKSATSDSFFGNAQGVFSGVTTVTSSIQFSSLNPKIKYDFLMLASRTATDNREVYFQVDGLTSQTALVNSASNTTNLAITKEIQPKSDGTIVVTVGAGANNNNSYKFYYLNSLQIKQNNELSSNERLTEESVNVRLKSNLVCNDLQVLGLDADLQSVYAVYDIDGRIIKTDNFNAANNSIDVSSLHPSYYVLTLSNARSTQSVRLPFIKTNR